MSFSESKPQINSIDNNLHSNDSKPVFTKNESFNELDPNRRLLTPSRLSEIISTQNRNQSLVYLNTKRLSESEDMSDRQNEELSPLFKRIKKEDNNCVVITISDSEQELDNCLDNGLNNINVLNPNLCNNSHKTSKKFKTKRFLKNIREQNSKVIKKLKVNVSGRITREEVELLIAFKNEGVIRKHRKIGLLFKCLLCNPLFNGWKSVEEHIKSDIHINNKMENNYSKFNSKFFLDLGKNSDIEVLLSRRQLMRRLSLQTKERLHSKGIRVKNGFGSDAFVCIECNGQPFESLGEVFNHLENKSKLINGLNNISLESKPGFSAPFGTQIFCNNRHKSSLNCDTIDNQMSVKKKNKKSKKSRKKKFNKKVNKSHEISIKSKYYINESKVIKELRAYTNGRLIPEEAQQLITFKNEGVVRNYYRSLFRCLHYFLPITEHQSVEEHLKCDTHIKNKCDSMFALHLHSKGIRVKNGFGSDAFVCIECNEQPFKSFDDVFNHLENRSIHLDLWSNGLNNINMESKPSFSASFGPQIVNSFDSNNCQ